MIINVYQSHQNNLLITIFNLQERFFLSASATPTGQIYPIPITYFTKSNRSLTLKPTYMMTTKTAVLQKTPGAEWIFVNYKQHGKLVVHFFFTAKA